MAANETPSFLKPFRDLLEGRLAELHTAMPALVESYDATAGTVSVSPCLKRKYVAESSAVELPVISNVPVLFPRGGNAAITFDLQKGDVVFLVFAERSVDAWKTVGDKVDPKDPRKHALSDAFAIPGGYPKVSPVAASLITAAFGSDGSLTVTSPAGEVSVAADGSFTVENESGDLALGADGGVTLNTPVLSVAFTAAGKVSADNGTAELIAQLLAVVDLIMQSQVATSLGLQPLIPDPTFAAERAKLDSFKA